MLPLMVSQLESKAMNDQNPVRKAIADVLRNARNAVRKQSSIGSVLERNEYARGLATHALDRAGILWPSPVLYL